MATVCRNERKIIYALSRLLCKELKFGRKFSTSKSTNKILTSVFPDVVIPDISFPDFFIRQTEKFKNRTALECFETGRKYTFDELTIRVNIFAASLRNKLNLRDGDAVCVILPNVTEYPIIALGIIKANFVCSTCNPNYKPEEIQRQLVNSTAKLIITVDTIYDNVDKANKALENPLPIIILRTQSTKVPKGTFDYEDLANPNTDTQILTSIRKPSPNDTVLRMYSSGTTGLPKGVDLTQRNLVANLLQQEATSILPPDQPKTIPGILPFFHILGLSVVLIGKLLGGHKIVNVPKFTKQNFVGLFKKHKPHALYVVPPLVLLMIAHKELTPAEFANLELIFIAAAPLSESDTKQLRQKLPPSALIAQGYGLTETSPVAICYHNRIKNYNPGSIGGVVPSTEVRFIDINTGEDVEEGQEGELWIRGPQLMKGYYNNERDTKEAITPDGWFKTGDIAKLAEGGQVYITDRLKELIKVKGFQVAPAELEAILRSHPAVIESAVVGVPHPFFGEAPKAFVILGEGLSVTEKELQDFVASQTTDYKHLCGGVQFVKDIPKSPAGKILRRQLKQEYA